MEKQIPKESHSLDCADKALAQLINSIPTKYKNMLIELIQFCNLPFSTLELESRLKKVSHEGFSVYTTENLCVMLLNVGALALCNKEGQLLDKKLAQPEAVVIDGVEYIKPSNEVEFFWIRTKIAENYILTFNLQSQIKTLIEEDGNYADVYMQILNLCSDEKKSSKEIEDAIDIHPSLQSPKKYAHYFVEKLERVGALVWSGKWETTKAGNSVLENL